MYTLSTVFIHDWVCTMGFERADRHKGIKPLQARGSRKKSRGGGVKGRPLRKIIFFIFKEETKFRRPLIFLGFNEAVIKNKNFCLRLGLPLGCLKTIEEI